MTVFSPLALWIARRGLRTRHTRKIFKTDTAPALGRSSRTWTSKDGQKSTSKDGQMDKWRWSRMDMQRWSMTWTSKEGQRNGQGKMVKDGQVKMGHLSLNMIDTRETPTTSMSKRFAEGCHNQTTATIWNQEIFIMFLSHSNLAIACIPPFEEHHRRTFSTWSREWTLLWRSSQSNPRPCKKVLVWHSAKKKNLTRAQNKGLPVPSAIGIKRVLGGERGGGDHDADQQKVGNDLRRSWSWW